MADSLSELARDIDATCHLTGTLKLRCGRIAGDYFDKQLFESGPQLLRRVGRGAEVVGRQVAVVEDIVSTGAQFVMP
ncbi:hypothetical protein [Janibacter limosus]|uniref:hypothetical protein n=1 Tax=Janibacter limosus TaxID=53458 RepID=UPI00082FCAD2|nr:hypothetical protein [Janibacter limosus]